MAAKALKLNIPLSVQLDLTYRCNERCIHCYLDHDDHGEMTTAEIKDLLDQMADAGVFYLTISGGEIMMRTRFFRDSGARARADVLHQAQDQRSFDSEEGSGAHHARWAWNRCRSASIRTSRSARRHYQDARLVPAVDRSGAPAAGARACTSPWPMC